MFKLIKNSFEKLRLNSKFLIIYVFCVIMPLVMTDVILFRSVYAAELSNQSYYRDISIEAYYNYLQDLLSYDQTLTTAIDVNKNINTFIDTTYANPIQYYDSLLNTVSNSFFSTMADMNSDRIVIYTDNNTMLSGHYFHNVSEAEEESWYEDFSESEVNEAAYAYYDDDPFLSSSDNNRFIYVRKMNNSKSQYEKIIKVEHKVSSIARELREIPVNCSMYLCCGDYVLYTNAGGEIDRQSLEKQAANAPYVTVKEYHMYGDTFQIYAFSDAMTITGVVRNNFLLIVIIVILTLIIPVILMKMLEQSITDRITVLEKAFGKADNKLFQPIREIKGSDEIASLMHQYNKIVNINNELTNTIYKDKLREQESDLARKNAELLALQSQINPHFMFNALESIRMHSIIKGENETAEMVQRLAMMERQNVEWHEDAVTIEEEEAFIDAYLQLQSYRFGDRISFDINICEDCKKIYIPKLTMVTFVENACVHGIESKSSQGWIFIRVSKNEENLTIEIEDTGDGMDENEVKSLQERMNSVTIDAVKKAKHVGILNACLRIKMMYKDRARFSIESEKGIGMSVIITIPTELITSAN